MQQNFYVYKELGILIQWEIYSGFLKFCPILYSVYLVLSMYIEKRILQVLQTE